jgi:hypothetical protein
MADDSIPSVPGGLAHLLTANDRRMQAARLDVLIARLHASGVLARYRSLASVQDIHARMRGLHEQFIAALAAGDVDHVLRGPTYFDAYVGLVLAMARAGDPQPFIPVDLWPSVPPPYPYSAEARMALQAILNLLREPIGLFTPGKLLLNAHYRLLAAHLLVSPEEIRQADALPTPYPWPFVIVLDAEGTPSLDRQPDLADEQRRAADRLESALRGSLKQAPPLPRGTRPAAVEKRTKKDQARFELGRVANELYKTTTPEAILAHPRFIAALEEARRATGATLHVGSADAVLRLITPYRQAVGLRLLPRGRPPSR